MLQEISKGDKWNIALLSETFGNGIKFQLEFENVEKINVGFTNTIYNINDTFIIKICTNNNNEKIFNNEIDFYKISKENSLIPKLYYSSTDKRDIPYFYEII